MIENSPNAVDFVFNRRGIGELSSSMSNLFWGFNHQNSGTAIRPNDDSKGFVFFTKPELNLTYDNIINADEMCNIVEEGTSNSQLGAIRAYLDPHNNIRRIGNNEAIMCPIVDAENVFIPLLSNTLISLDGWPDVSVETYTSETGIFGEARSYADGGSCIYGTYELNATFQNIKGDPITSIFFHWCSYINRVSEGSIYPYREKLVENEIDYETRIYRVVLNESKTMVTKIACTGASFPLGSTIGAAYSYNAERPYSEENQQIPITFRCNGAIYESPRIIEAFNDAVGKWNKKMIPNDDGVITQMRRLTHNEAEMMNWEGYPRIEADRRIFYYVTHERYSEFLNYYGIDPDTVEEQETEANIQTPISPDVSAEQSTFDKLAKVTNVSGNDYNV